MSPLWVRGLPWGLGSEPSLCGGGSSCSRWLSTSSRSSVPLSIYGKGSLAAKLDQHWLLQLSLSSMSQATPFL